MCVRVSVGLFLRYDRDVFCDHDDGLCGVFCLVGVLCVNSQGMGWGRRWDGMVDWRERRWKGKKK